MGATPLPAVAQDDPGPFLPLPGYGGATGGLEQLAARLRAAGRDATAVPLPGEGTGDLGTSADALAVRATRTRTGAASVHIFGYSAGGVVARRWARDGGAAEARRIITLAPRSTAPTSPRSPAGCCPTNALPAAGDAHVDAPTVLWRLRELLRLLPDTVRLLGRLAGDGSLPRGVRVRLWLLLAYLALPVDLVPDFIPVLGYADDAIVVALVLRSVVRRAGPDAVASHWPRNPEGLSVLRQVARIRA